MVRLAIALVPFALCIQLAAGLWPMPTNLKTGTTPLRLSSSFAIDVHVSNAPSDLSDAVARTKAFLVQDKLQRLVVGRGASDAQGVQAAKTLSTLSVSIVGSRPVQSISKEAILDLSERSEAYSLTVPSDGSEAKLTAESTLGLLRGFYLHIFIAFSNSLYQSGLTTFSQLWYQLQNTIYTMQAPVAITNDSPAYPYRGFMLDTARNLYAFLEALLLSSPH